MTAQKRRERTFTVDRTRAGSRCLSAAQPLTCSAHAEQVDDEHERLAGRDGAAGAAVAVPQLRGDGQPPAAAHPHAGHAAVPAGDDLAGAEAEAERLAT